MPRASSSACRASERVEPATELGQCTCTGDAPFRGFAAGSVGLVGRCPRRGASNRRLLFGFRGLGERVLRGRQPRLDRGPLLPCRVDLDRGLGCTTFDVGQPPPRSLELGVANRLGAPDGSEILAPRPALGSERRQLGQGVGQRPFGLAELTVEVHVPSRDRPRQRPTLDDEARPPRRHVHRATGSCPA